jgi:MFS superfamily sulfate permease-like transporter
LPSVQIPPFSIDEIRSENGTVIQAGESFGEMIGNIGSGLIVLPLITLLECISVCKAFANGKSVDATQELIAIGAANLFNSFVQAYPGTGALSRGAVFNSSGVQTPLANLYKSILVIVSLLFLTPLFYYIPKASLAGLIIAAVVFMVEYKVVKPMWRSKSENRCFASLEYFAQTFNLSRIRFGSWYGDLRRMSRASPGDGHFGRYWPQYFLHPVPRGSTKDPHGTTRSKYPS